MFLVVNRGEQLCSERLNCTFSVVQENVWRLLCAVGHKQCLVAGALTEQIREGGCTEV